MANVEVGAWRRGKTFKGYVYGVSSLSEDSPTPELAQELQRRRPEGPRGHLFSPKICDSAWVHWGEGLSLFWALSAGSVGSGGPLTRWRTHMASQLVLGASWKLSWSRGPRPQFLSMRPLCRLLGLPHCKTAGFQEQTENKVEARGIL